jgi:hypothetical protein
MITLCNQHDPDLRITLAPPPPNRFEDVYAEWFDAQGAGREYFAATELVRGCAIEPRPEQIPDLFRAWSALPLEAWPYCANFAGVGIGEHIKLDPRALLDGSEESERHLHALAEQGVSRADIEEYIRTYPRKGPPGAAQLVIARFPWGYYGCRAAEPQEWFDTEENRRAGQFYELAKRFVKSCTLFPDVPSILTRNRTAPALVSILAGFIKTAAGEGLAKRVGE